MIHSNYDEENVDKNCRIEQRIIGQYIERVRNTLSELDVEKIERVVKILQGARLHKKGVFIFGNGGSAATASHFACDLNKGAICLGQPDVVGFKLHPQPCLLPQVLQLLTQRGNQAQLSQGCRLQATNNPPRFLNSLFDLSRCLVNQPLDIPVIRCTCLQGLKILKSRDQRLRHTIVNIQTDTLPLLLLGSHFTSITKPALFFSQK